MNKIKVGLVGVGNHSKENIIPAIKTLENVTISAVYSRDINKAKEICDQIHAEKYFDSLDAMRQEGKVDAFIVTTVPAHHEELIKYAIKNNICIFVEKPPFSSYQTAMMLCEEILNSGRDLPIQFGFNFRFSDFFKKVEVLAQGFEDVCHLKIKSYASKPLEKMWGYKDVFESSLYAIHIHAIEMMCYVNGKVKNVRKEINWISSDKFVANIIIKFENGKTGLLELSNCANKFEYDTEFILKNGTIIRVNSFNKFEIIGRDYSPIALFKGKDSIHFETPFLQGGFERTGYSSQFVKFMNDINNKLLDKKGILACLETYKIIYELTK